MPAVFADLVTVYQRLEGHYRDMQDIEFTVERGKLWMLQTRNGKRTAKAALKIAVDMANEGLVTRDEAIANSAQRRHFQGLSKSEQSQNPWPAPGPSWPRATSGHLPGPGRTSPNASRRIRSLTRTPGPPTGRFGC